MILPRGRFRKAPQELGTGEMFYFCFGYFNNKPRRHVSPVCNRRRHRRIPFHVSSFHTSASAAAGHRVYDNVVCCQ